MLKSPTQSSATAIARKVTQVTLLIAIVILIAGGLGLYLLNNKIGDEQKVEAAKLAEVGSNKQIAGRYQTALATFNQTEGQLQYLEASVPQNQYVPTLLVQLQALAKSTNLVVQSVRPATIQQATQDAPSAPASSGDSDSGPAVKKTIPLTYSTMNVQIEVHGTYANIMRFIYDIPRFPKILSVQSITLHPLQDDQLSATMSVTAYVFDPAKDVTIDKPLQRVLQENGIPTPAGAISGATRPAGAVTPVSDETATPTPPIAGAAAQAAFQKAGMTPEARAIGVARDDAAVADEQSKGQGILVPETGSGGPASPNNAGGTAKGQGGTR